MTRPTITLATAFSAVTHQLIHHAYALDEALLVTLRSQYGVTILDDTRAPHEICFGGTAEGLTAFFDDYLRDLYDEPEQCCPKEMGILTGVVHD